jgi:prepilin-type processing-associated H-X9-DG protein
MEEDTLYDRFDFKKTALTQGSVSPSAGGVEDEGSSSFRQPQETFVRTYLCPSDGALGRYYVDDEFTQGIRFAKGNYAAYVSPYHTDLQFLYPGAFIANRSHKLSKVTDGTSKTIVFSEVRTLDHLQDERGVWAIPWNAASLLALDMHHDANAAGGRFSGYVPQAAYAYQSQLPNSNLKRSNDPTKLPANYDVLMRCPDDALVEAQLQGMPCGKWIHSLGITGYISSAPRSYHVGGVNIAFLDGHVRFLHDDVDPFTFVYLIDIRDGHLIESDE